MTQKVFISYSWTTPKHEEWVMDLGKRLMSDGIDVVLDKWDLKEGHDMNHFMESMVTSAEINKVLMILDKNYSDKANARKGGVGTETQIISAKVYSNVSQEKFIPIVAERSEDGNAYIPTFLDGRLYVDLSSDEQFESNYESLIRNIYNKPSQSKPKLGNAPSYLFEDTPINFSSTNVLRSFENQISKHPNRINSIIRDYLDKFFENLKDFKISFDTQDRLEMGKIICDSIKQYTPLRDELILFIFKILKSDEAFDFDIIIKFIENICSLREPWENQSSWKSIEFDNFKFIVHELFISLIAIGLKNENFQIVEDLFYSSYFTKDRYNNRIEAKSYSEFYNYIDSIDAYYCKLHSKRFFSPMAELMVTRVHDSLSKNNLVEADLLCHHIAKLNQLERGWFPQLYVYNGSNSMELFYKLVSLKYFEKVKGIFGVSTLSEFKNKIKKFKEENKDSNRASYSNSFDSVVPLYDMMDIDLVGSLR